MKTIPGLLIISTLLTLSLPASATDIRVRVFDRGNKVPMTSAAVCLGTSARIDQFGAHVTDAEGYVSFSSVPRAPLVTSSTNRMRVMSLSAGGGGTPCPLGDSAAKVYTSSLGVIRFALNNGKSVTAGNRVTLNNKTNGQPTQYRASERADFQGSNWQNYTTAPIFELSPGAGRKVVYFQVRRHAATGGANIETLSPTARSSITVQ